MRRLVKGIRMAEFHFSPNAVDVSLLFALALDRYLSGAWKGPSSAATLAAHLMCKTQNAVTGTGRLLFIEKRFFPSASTP